jgi:hypothetical protein
MNYLGLTGIIYETVRPKPVEGIFTIAKSFDKACPEHVEGLSPNGSNANGQFRFKWYLNYQKRQNPFYLIELHISAFVS